VPEAKKCPLRRVTYRGTRDTSNPFSSTPVWAEFDYCYKEKCAWWDSQNNSCAVLVLAQMARNGIPVRYTHRKESRRQRQGHRRKVGGGGEVPPQRLPASGRGGCPVEGYFKFTKGK